VFSGLCKITFPLSKRKEKVSAAPSNSTSTSINLGLEGEIGALQKRCYHELINKCKEIAAEVGANQWTTIMSVQALRAISVAMPETPNEMLQLPGVTKANFEKYGDKLLEISVRYSAEKFSVLAEHQDNIEDFDDEPQPSTSASVGTSRVRERAPKKTVSKPRPKTVDDGWIDMDSQESRYFSTSSKPKARSTSKSKPRKAFNYGAKRKSVSSQGRKKASPKKATGAKKTGPKSNSRFGGAGSSSGGGGACIGFMPMPMPK